MFLGFLPIPISPVCALPFSCFEIRSSFFVQAGLDSDSLIYASHIAGMTDTRHQVQLLVEMGSNKLFACAGLEPLSS
jgi:hypothetical protein